MNGTHNNPTQTTKSPNTPKIIHYCWFGRKKKPPGVLSYINQWSKTLPNYEIIEWNEDNFDTDTCTYVKEAYAENKFAFVSDYVRLHALYHHGGIYLDTDVEVVRPLDDLLTGSLVFGFEEFNYIATSTLIAPKKSMFIKDFMESYHARSFYTANGGLDQTTNVQKITEILESSGLVRNGQNQTLTYLTEEIIILDQAKLSPLDYPNGIIKSDASTYTIHHFGQSWGSGKNKIKKVVKDLLIKIIGGGNLKTLRAKISRQSHA